MKKRRSMIQKMNLVISVKQNNIDIGLLYVTQMSIMSYDIYLSIVVMFNYSSSNVRAPSSFS